MRSPLGDERHALTRYIYGDTGILRDLVHRIVPPKGDITVISYYPNGNREWIEDARGRSSRISFQYYDGTQLLHTIARPDDGTDSLFYDAQGNLSRHRSAMNVLTTRYRDGLGRDTLVESPIGATEPLRIFTRYDLMDRVIKTRSEGPELTYSCDVCQGTDPTYGMPTPREILFVTYDYDDEGNLTDVVRSIDPTPAGLDTLSTTYSYDRAQRKTSEVHHSSTQMYTYDPAGNQTTWTRGTKEITSEYDALNQMTRRIVPEVFYREAKCDGNWPRNSPCLAGLAFDSLRVPEDVQTFSYDAGGRLTAAHNRYARIRRTYYPGGALRSDTLRLRTYGAPGLPSSGGGGGGGGGGGPCRPSNPECEPIRIESVPEGVAATSLAAGSAALPGDPYPDDEFRRHVFGLGYDYDENGRRTALVYPDALAPDIETTVSYGYNSWGALETITGLMGDDYRYEYDASGRLERLTYPGSQVKSFLYDLDGRLVRRHLGAMYDDTLTYYPSGKVKKATLRASMREAEQWYSGLGHVVAARWNSTNGSDYGVDEFRYDAHGHQYWSRKRDPLTPAVGAPVYDHRYEPSGALSEIRFRAYPDYPGGTNVFRDYDHRTGDLLYGSEAPHEAGLGLIGLDPVRYYYGADGALRDVKKYSRRWNPYTGQITAGHDLIQEVRYDALGRRVVQHTRSDPYCSSDCDAAIERYVWDGDQLLYELRADGGGSYLETAWGSGPQYGRTGYVHGPGTDAPLAVMRSDFGSSPAIRITPLANWRGQYERGLFAGGWPECTGQNSPSCIHVEWPAPKLRTYLDAPPQSRGDWVGSLIQGQRDQSGLMYRRNRYYDPSTGQFTQEDPIGLAGGLNLYGYAGGDPVNFSDPFGLCPWHRRSWFGLGDRCPGDLTVREWRQVEGATEMMSDFSAGRIRNALDRGRIRGFAGTKADSAGKVMSGQPHIIQINRTFHDSNVFDDLDFLARVLLHEDRHVQQFRGKKPGQEVSDYIKKFRERVELDAIDYMRRHYVPNQ